VQPISGSLAGQLRPWLASKMPGEPEFGNLTRNMSKMIQRDLARAGIPISTSAGVADFHSLRVTYNSNVVATGASVKTCQELERQAAPSLTMGVYAKTRLYDLRTAVSSLPGSGTPAPKPDALRTTGTDPRSIATKSATSATKASASGSTRVEAPQEWAESESNRRHQDFQSSRVHPLK
jgi:hypothetical protein